MARRTRTIRVIDRTKALEPTHCACGASLALGVSIGRDGTHECLSCRAWRDRVATATALARADREALKAYAMECQKLRRAEVAAEGAAMRARCDEVRAGKRA